MTDTFNTNDRQGDHQDDPLTAQVNEQPDHGGGTDGDDLPDLPDLPDTDEIEVGWIIEGFDPSNPFTASIVFTDGSHNIWADLNPQALAQLHDALGQVRTAQRAAILGVPFDSPAATEHTSQTSDTGAATDTPSTTDTPTRKWSRKTLILATIGGLVGACVLYSLTAGAVLI